ncbi:AP-5 complex subunit sigma-1 [Candoia aspera]|uniref:AP-5 complex subunit sigma-1 n=1 Tax=Candoia aspera TaxID=51853 RepID=UPI002FD7D828
MVHAFLILALGGRPGEDAAGPCRVLYSRAFAAEGPEDGQEQEKARLGQKERMLAVARQVEAVCKLQQTVTGKRHPEHLHQPPEDMLSLQETPLGVFRLPTGDPFSEDKTVLWLGVQCLAFALVCDPDENIMLAESTLRLVVNALLEHLKLLSSGSNVLLKTDRMEVILGKFLPHGQLLFLNDQFVVGLERELSAHLGK